VRERVAIAGAAPLRPQPFAPGMSVEGAGNVRSAGTAGMDGDGTNRQWTGTGGEWLVARLEGWMSGLLMLRGVWVAGWLVRV